MAVDRRAQPPLARGHDPALRGADAGPAGRWPALRAAHCRMRPDRHPRRQLARPAECAGMAAPSGVEAGTEPAPDGRDRPHGAEAALARAVRTDPLRRSRRDRRPERPDAAGAVGCARLAWVVLAPAAGVAGRLDPAGTVWPCPAGAGAESGQAAGGQGAGVPDGRRRRPAGALCRRDRRRPRAARPLGIAATAVVGHSGLAPRERRRNLPSRCRLLPATPRRT